LSLAIAKSIRAELAGSAHRSIRFDRNLIRPEAISCWRIVAARATIQDDCAQPGATARQTKIHVVEALDLLQSRSSLSFQLPAGPGRYDTARRDPALSIVVAGCRHAAQPIPQADTIHGVI
jgi:tetraacyldisaccharide-1-P 4'-kinase